MSKAGIYEVQEFHRGDWQPIIIKGSKKPMTVAIPHERAERLNGDSKATKMRYVKQGSEEKSEGLEELAAAFEEKFGKKPHHKWDAEKIQSKLNEAE